MSILEDPNKRSDLPFPQRLDFHSNNPLHDTSRQRPNLLIILHRLHQNRALGPRQDHRQGKETKIDKEVDRT